MNVDEEAFFHEATLKICSSLDIEKALWRCFMYVRNFIPADLMVLSYMSPDSGGVRIVARASVEGGERSDDVISLPSETVDRAMRSLLPEVLIVDQPDEHPVLKHTIKHVEIENPSIIIDRLIIEGKFLGGMTIIAEGSGKYTNEHARLFSLLREPASIALSNCLRYQEILKLKELLADDNRYLQDELRRTSGEEIVGADFGLKGVMDLMRHVAPLESPVIVLGETGTGKELVARAIHNLSPRWEGPFIKVNCGAIPNTLMDSELFGHEKGSFTGALTQKRGRFERAHNGTIFLDEIGELSSEAQVRLLRVLQEKEIERVGGTKSINVNIRVIAATHRDLLDMIQEGRFREDLFFRLNVFPIVVPPLRERTGDIPALVQHFIMKKTREMGLLATPALAVNAIEQLKAYQWPGNVRELENAVERALILSRGNKALRFDELTMRIGNSVETEHYLSEEESHSLDTAMRQHIRLVLETTAGKVGGDRGAAKLLGINPSTLRHRMKKLGIPYGRKLKIP